MKIGISTSVVQRGRTGVGQYLFALIRALLPYSGRHQFMLFVLREDLPLFQFAAAAMQLVPVDEVFRPPVKDIFWHQVQLPRVARQHKIDVLHVPSYRRQIWTRPCALVATIHDLAAFWVVDKYDWKRMFYGRVVARQLARRQDQVIAISRNTAADITRFFGLPAERLRVIHNGLDHERFFPGSNDEAKAAARRRHGLQRPFFLYVSRLEHPGKNHVRLITAFNQFKAATGSEWQLVLAGSDWHGAEAIHDAARQSPFATDIRMLGFAADADLPELYRAADVFLYPSLYEGFGLPVLEAMACGCPVLSSTRGALGEIIADAAETVDPENLNEMEFRLGEMSSGPELRSRLRLAGLRRAKEFNWEKTASATMDTYAQALARESMRSKPPANFRGFRRNTAQVAFGKKPTFQVK